MSFLPLTIEQGGVGGGQGAVVGRSRALPQYEVQGYRVGTGFVFSFRGNQSVSYRFRGTDITRKLGSSCGCGKSDGGCCGKSDRTVIQCQGAGCICSTENGCARADGKADTFHIVVLAIGHASGFVFDGEYKLC